MVWHGFVSGKFLIWMFINMYKKTKNNNKKKNKKQQQKTKQKQNRTKKQKTTTTIGYDQEVPQSQTTD